MSRFYSILGEASIIFFEIFLLHLHTHLTFSTFHFPHKRKFWRFIFVVKFIVHASNIVNAWSQLALVFIHSIGTFPLPSEFRHIFHVKINNSLSSPLFIIQLAFSICFSAHTPSRFARRHFNTL